MGEIVAIELRGAWLGNRGVLHQGDTPVRFHRGPLWIICALEFRGRRLPQWAVGHCTVLFFHDEAVALAAGHRPCALCRRPDYQAFRQAWVRGNGGDLPAAVRIDRRLHAERLVPRTRRRRLHPADLGTLPTGSFVRSGEDPALVLDGALVPWTAGGYRPERARPARGRGELITPPSTVAALRAGYRPQIDRGATG